MARPRDPSAVQKLKGVKEKNPKRMRQEPEPSGPLGTPPAHLTNEEKAVWFELEAIVPPRVLMNDCRIVVETTCKLLAHMRKEGIGGRYGLSNGQLSILMQCLSKLGLTPADRSKVVVAPEKQEENEFAEFAETAPASSKSGSKSKPN